MTMPSLFISHGSPMLALGGHPTTAAWAQLGKTLPRPRAIVVASAHWLTAAPTVSAASAPATIHDFHGFPAPLYALRYPARGDAERAAGLARRLAEAGLPPLIDSERGLDHGVWVPLLQLFPDADVPVVSLAIQPRLGPDHHLRLGRALRPLLAEDVVVIGSGSLTHNLHDAVLGDDDPAHIPAYVGAFAGWFAQQLASGDDAALVDYRRLAPEAARAHPTEEHLLPLYVALGAAGPRPRSERLYSAFSDGSLAMDVYAFTPTG